MPQCDETLSPQPPRAVEYHQEARSHIGEHGHPRGARAGLCDHQEHCLDTEGERDVLLENR